MEILPRKAPGDLLPKGFGPLDADKPERGQDYGFDPPKVSGDTRRKPPADHRHDYLRRHGAIARADRSACTSCHTPQQCLDCHAGAQRPIDLHPPGYLAFHALEAKRDASACDGCHSPQTFCKSCHDTVRAGTSGAAAPRPGLRFHPASWLGEGIGPNHGDEARRNLWACTSCHTEKDCVSCHTNVNPHPPGWRTTCRSVLAADPRSCVSCHADLTSLRSRCL